MPEACDHRTMLTMAIFVIALTSTKDDGILY